MIEILKEGLEKTTTKTKGGYMVKNSQIEELAEEIENEYLKRVAKAIDFIYDDLGVKMDSVDLSKLKVVTK